MNPEEGALRPQLQDRFGLRVLVDGLTDADERLEVYRRVRSFREHPHRLIATLLEDTMAFGDEISRARELLPQVELALEAEQLVLRTVRELGISSHRAEITTLEAARAYAAADDRQAATVEDVAAVVPMALRQRRSQFIREYFESAQAEDAEIERIYRTVQEKGA
jgi:magnesium chelatase subunit I